LALLRCEQPISQRKWAFSLIFWKFNDHDEGKEAKN
jgi:hypothetical protein